jgi:hypothetical protein
VAHLSKTFYPKKSYRRTPSKNNYVNTLSMKNYPKNPIQKPSSSSSVALQPGSGLGLPLRVFVMVRYVRCGVISPMINLF